MKDNSVPLVSPFTNNEIYAQAKERNSAHALVGKIDSRSSRDPGQCALYNSKTDAAMILEERGIRKITTKDIIRVQQLISSREKISKGTKTS